MRKGRAFRPAVGDALEDRTVPSGTNGTALTGLIVSGPSPATQAVNQAFQTFERSYAKDVYTILYGSGGPSTATRTAFDAQVATDLQTLEGSIQSALGTGNDSLNASIDDMLTGTASTSLQNELKALPTPAAQTGWFAWLAPSRFLARSNRDIVPVVHQVTQQVRTATAPSGTIDSATVQSLLRTVNTAFTTFRTSYFGFVKSDLPTSGAATSGQQTQFHSDVNSAIATMTDTITAAVQSNTALAPIASSLVTTITNDLQTPATSPTGASLQERLGNVSLPNGGWLSNVWFRFGSAWTINVSQARVTWDILSAVRTYNNSLS